MVTAPQPSAPSAVDNATFDAWNRMVLLSSGGSPIQQNGYDGQNRRVTKLVSGTTRHCYYSSAWQPLEERLGSVSTADRQFVWGERYIDDIVLRDRGAERFYALQDPNLNVTGICAATGSIAERYAYSAYGQPAFLNAAFVAIGASAYAWETLFGGYRLDPDSMLLLARRRVLNAALGAWTARDPFTFLDSSSLYEYVRSSPLNYTDPTGTITGECRLLLNLPFRADPAFRFLNFNIGLFSGLVCFGASISASCTATAYPIFHDLASRIK